MTQEQIETREFVAYYSAEFILEEISWLVAYADYEAAILLHEEAVRQGKLQ